MANLALAFDILARDKGASKTFKTVGDSAEKAGKKGERFGSLVKGGIGVAAGAIAAAGLGTAFVGFISGAAESAKIGRLTNAVIASTGGAAKITADQVDALATSMSNKTGQDDEMIASAANVLLTFTKVRNEAGKGNDIFNQGAEAALNMSVALGQDLQGATTMLGKALNDPIKGITAMSRAGVQFTEQQKDQIKAMAEAGDVLGAQKIILGELETQFAGAAEAAADPLDRLKVIAGNLGEQVGGVLLPHVEDFATYLGETVAPKLAEFIAGMESGEGAGGWFADAFTRVKDAATATWDFIRDEVIPRGQAFVALIRDDVLPRLQEFGGYMRDELGPRVADAKRWFDEDLRPALVTFRDFLRDEFTPSWEALVDVYNNDVKPGLDDLRAAFERNKPELMEIARLVGALVAGMLIMEVKIRATILPVLIDLAGFLGGTLFTEIGKTVDKVGFLVTKAGEMKDAFKEFMEAVREFKLPGWITGVAGASAGVAAAIKGATTGILGAIGDGPGRNSGGNTLNRVRGLLPTGAVITSTYRTPAQNRAVGGVTGSYHTDRGNPAVDIAGSRAAMDAVHARLAAVGGWRELLYKTKGHWDHVHVAHQGGTVSANWPTMPGWGANERPVRAEVGETIVPRGQQQPSKVYNLNVVNQERRMTGADLVMATRAAEALDPAW